MLHCDDLETPNPIYSWDETSNLNWNHNFRFLYKKKLKRKKKIQIVFNQDQSGTNVTKSKGSVLTMCFGENVQRCIIMHFNRSTSVSTCSPRHCFYKVQNHPEGKQESFTFDKVTEETRAIHLLALSEGTGSEKSQSRVLPPSFPSPWQLNPCGCLQHFPRVKSHEKKTEKEKKTSSCVCVFARQCHHLRLRGDDVPLSQAPAAIRAVGRSGEGRQGRESSLVCAYMKSVKSSERRHTHTHGKKKQ